MNKDERWYRNEHGEMIYETMSKDELVHELVVLAADLDIIEELEAEIQTKKVLGDKVEVVKVNEQSEGKE